MMANVRLAPESGTFSTLSQYLWAKALDRGLKEISSFLCQGHDSFVSSHQNSIVILSSFNSSAGDEDGKESRINEEVRTRSTETSNASRLLEEQWKSFRTNKILIT
jgi:hypothetical protein